MTLRKQLAITLATLVIGALLIGGGTFAYFSDTVTSANNTFATGTILFNEATSFTAQTPGNNQPGDADDFTFALDNDGTLDMDHIYLGMTYDAPDIDTPADNNGLDLGTQLKVNSITLGGTAVTIPNAAYGDDLILTLSELETYLASNTLDIGGILADTTENAVIQIEFMETNVAQNQYQGEAATINFSFEARN